MAQLTWFVIAYREDSEKYYHQLNVLETKVEDIVFNDPGYLGAKKIVDSLYFDDSQLHRRYRIFNIAKMTATSPAAGKNQTLIISRHRFSKLVYAKSL